MLHESPEDPIWLPEFPFYRSAAETEVAVETEVEVEQGADEFPFYFPSIWEPEPAEAQHQQAEQYVPSIWEIEAEEGQPPWEPRMSPTWSEIDRAPWKTDRVPPPETYPYLDWMSKALSTWEEEPDRLELQKVEEESDRAPPETYRILDWMSNAMCERREFGSTGDKVWVKANHFHLTFRTLPDQVACYIVEIIPEMAQKKIRRHIVMKAIKIEKWCRGSSLAFDGRNRLYVSTFLPDMESHVNYKHGSKDTKGVNNLMFLTKLCTCSMWFSDLKESPSNRYAVVGRSFFSPVDDGVLGNDVFYRQGFHQSLRSTQMGLSLNMDTCAKPFIRPGLVSSIVVSEGFDFTKMIGERDRIKLQKALKGVIVETFHGPFRRQYKILWLTKASFKELRFPSDSSRTKYSTLAEYFKHKYGLGFKFANLPAVYVANGTSTKPLYLQMQLCRIVEGQRYSGKLNENQITELLSVTLKKPEERVREIKKLVAWNNYNEDNAGFGIQVSKEMTYLEARVLPPPMVKYHGASSDIVVLPSEGRWKMMDRKVIDGENIEFWACINFSTKLDNTTVGKFCTNLINTCISKGMNCSREPLVPTRRAQPSGLKFALYSMESETISALEKLNVIGKQLQLLIEKIKRICETELEIVSQCFKPASIAKTNLEQKQLIENVSLKINAKKALIRLPFECVSRRYSSSAWG
ncbi:argonaute 5 [Orobanche hederae]